MPYITKQSWAAPLVAHFEKQIDASLRAAEKIVSRLSILRNRLEHNNITEKNFIEWNGRLHAAYLYLKGAKALIDVMYSSGLPQAGFRLYDRFNAMVPLIEECDMAMQEFVDDVGWHHLLEEIWPLPGHMTPSRGRFAHEED
jgi:hypothetical protein